MDSLEKSVVARMFRIFKRARGTMLLRRALSDNFKGFFFITESFRDSKPPNESYLVQRSTNLGVPAKSLAKRVGESSPPPYRSVSLRPCKLK